MNTYGREKLRAGVLGLAVGDAFGMPFECGKRGAFDIYAGSLQPDGSRQMRGYRPGDPAWFYEENGEMAAGIWTDDTAMTLAELESVARLGRVDPDDIMRNFCRWHYEGAFSATGTAIGQGKQTVNALTRYKAGTPAADCGGRGERDNGDGSLMRMLPFAFLPAMLARDGVTVRALSSLTHGHPVSVTACEIYLVLAEALIAGADRALLRPLLEDRAAPYGRLPQVPDLPQEEISSSGYVVSALEASVWCLFTAESFEDCVVRAVQLGGDTDTIAAIAGSLAGLLWGMDAIPAQWKEALFRREEILALCDRFAAVAE